MIKVALSFAEQEKEIASQIASGLIEHNIQVVSEISLEDKISVWGKPFYEVIDRKFNSSVEYCIALLTEHYYRQNWNGYYKERLIQNIIEREGFVLPVIIDNNRLIPEILKSRSPIRIKRDEFQTVIDSFIRKISVTENIRHGEIESYEDLQMILTLFNNKLEINKISQQTDRILDKKIGFDIFSLLEPVKQQTSYYVIYLYKGATLKNTIGYIKSNYGKVVKEKDKLLVLFPIEDGQKDLSKRKDNISNYFENNASCFYIKDFIWKFCTPQTFTESFDKQPLDDFVSPNILNNEESKATDYILDWLYKDNNPILVLRGIGGIGKTTTAKWFTNYIHDKIPNTKAIFIDSTETIKYLKRKIGNNFDEIDLYSFYEADFENRKSKVENIVKLKSEEFKCNLDNGNIIIIIDGLDEVISKLENNFNTDAFFNSVHSFSNQFGKGKIIITCRNYFWDYSDKKSGVSTAEILPFNEKLAEKYFRSKYSKNYKLVQKGLQIASGLTIKRNSNDEGKIEYIPYVLDMTSYIIDSKQNFDGLIEDVRFSSNMLSLNVDNDYIIFKICQREMKKLNQILDVDQQIELFITISNDYNGIIKPNDLQNLLQYLFKFEIEDESLDTFKAHPLLFYNSDNDIVRFRYDLLNDFFQNVYVTQILLNKKKVNVQNLKSFKQISKYDSRSMRNVYDRIKEIENEHLFLCLEVLDQINNIGDESRKSSIMKKKAIGDLFSFMLFLWHKTKPNDVTSNTEFLKEYFVNHSNTICNLTINNLTSICCKQKIIFDFSDLILKNSLISNYEFFGVCKFNNNTLFNNCKLEDLHLNPNSECNFKTNNFKNCDLDDSLKDFLKSRVESNISNKQNIQEDLIDFLGLFCGKGRTIYISDTVLKNRYRPKSISFNEMIKCLKKNEILNNYRLNGSLYYEIEKNKRYDVINFVQQDKMSIPIKNTFDTLYKLK